MHWTYLFNKKVLLRERKRHTDRSVSSTPYAVLSWGGGGGRYLGWGGRYLRPGRGVGTLDGGVGTLDGGRYLGWGVGALARGGGG